MIKKEFFKYDLGMGMRKYKIPAVLAALALVLPVAAVAPSAIASADSDKVFTDVSASQPLGDHVKWAKEKGLVKGWRDGSFRPHESVSREAMAAFMYRLAGKPAFNGSLNCFKDVSPATTQFAKEICWMKAKKLTNGWSDGTYRPRESVQRVATVAFLHRLVGEPYVGNMGALYNKAFVDISVWDDNPFGNAILWAKSRGITKGYPDRTFRPTLPIERIAMAAFLHRFSEYRSDFNKGKGTDPKPSTLVSPSEYKQVGEKFAETVRAKLLEKINQGRAEAGAKHLQPVQEVTNYAQNWTNFMADNDEFDALWGAEEYYPNVQPDFPEIQKFNNISYAFYENEFILDTDLRLGQKEYDAEKFAEYAYSELKKYNLAQLTNDDDEDYIGIGIASNLNQEYKSPRVTLVFVVNSKSDFRNAEVALPKPVTYQNPQQLLLPYDPTGKFMAVRAPLFK